MSIAVRRRLLAAAGVAVIGLLTAAPVFAHEERTVAGYDMEVGLIAEPVYVGDKSGLEFSVEKEGQPVTGLETTLTAQVLFGGQSRDLPLSARDGAPGWYESVFIPTAAGPYTFHISGTIEGNAIDESFTSSPTGFNEVQEVTSGQFPVALPPITDIAAQADKGAAAASQATLALAVGAAGVLVGLIGIGLAIGALRRSA